ncbi:histidine kinase [candidate division KSB1 bacterium]|nr:histidine kinase [candidate division KSB1 bacterium]
MSQAWKKRGFILLIWLFAGVMSGGQSWYFRVAAGREVPWGAILVTSSTFAGLWFLLTPVIMQLSSRFRIERGRILRRIGLHLLFAMLLALFQQTAFNLIALYAQAAPISFARVSQLAIANFDYGILVYFVILLVQHAWNYYERMQAEQVRAAQLQAELATAQLQALKMQLHPHFLFNTLNTIAVLIHENPQVAARMLEQLSDLLRHTLKNSGTQEVALQQELEFLRLYLEIEQTRFGDRLTVRMNIAPDTLAARVPNLILQPLVENAIRHGVAKRRGPGMIGISAERENGVLRLRVRDNGYGPVAIGESNHGIGLANTRARLQTLYGLQGELKLENIAEGGALAEIVLPFSPTAQHEPISASEVAMPNGAQRSAEAAIPRTMNSSLSLGKA